MSAAILELERRGAALILRLNRPERMNALSRELIAELGRVGRELDDDPSVRALVLTGAGDRAFCAGADLKERQSLTDAEVAALIASYERELGWLDQSPRPVVAAINGVALGGGLELALLCDLRVAHERAILGLPETSLGIIPGAGGTQRLPRIVGEARAKELILLGRRLSAAEALTYGLVHRVSPSAADLVEDTLAYIAPILEGAPIAQRVALRAIDAAAELPLAQGLQLERELYRETLESDDRREALLAFAEKRKPVFRGQ